MPLRLTGLSSGIDSDSAIQELMAAKRLQVTKVENKQTKLTWTQEKWKDLNKKLYALYTGELTKMKTQGNYLTKKVSSSNENYASATATSTAVAGAHTLQVNALASAQYITGAQINASSTSDKLVSALGVEEGSVIEIKANQKTITCKVDASTTLGDFISKLKDAGLNASFDTKQKRLFISSKESGSDNNFTLISSKNSFSTQYGKQLDAIKDSFGTTQMNDALKVLKSADIGKLKTLSGISGTTLGANDYELLEAYDFVQSKISQNGGSFDLDGALQNYTKAVEMEQFVNGISGTDAKKHFETLKGASSQEIENILAGDIPTDETDADYNRYQQLSSAYNTLKGYLDGDTGELNSILNTYKDSEFPVASGLWTDIAQEAEKVSKDPYIDDYMDALKSASSEDLAELLAAKESGSAVSSSLEALNEAYEYITDSMSTASQKSFRELLTNYANNKEEITSSTSALEKLGLGEITDDTTETTTATTGMSYIKAKDAQITFDGVALTGSSNSFTVNGITLDLKGTTGAGERITLNVSNDTTAAYDMIKNFVTKYNEILKEMNELYNAKTAKGYDPLTDDQKAAMTDDQVEKWETKIKDSLLRRDSTLEGVITAMRQSLQVSTKIGDKSYALSSFGIRTSSDYSEKGLLHIFGDADDDTYSSEDNLLKKALEEDADTVMQVLSKTMQGLYDEMTKKMARTSLSSALTFYNDKQIDTQLTTYKKQITSMEKKLQETETRYYKQFTAMETAMSKLQSQSNYLSSMLGTS